MKTADEIIQEEIAAGVPEAEVIAWAQSEGLIEPETEWGNIARSTLGQGLAFGFGDEIEAMVSSRSLPGSPEYTQQRDQIRGEINQWQQKNPGTALLSELGGGLLGGGPLAAGAKWLGKNVLKIAAPTLTGAIATGAGEGALVGAGQAKEMSNIPDESLKGAMWGGGLTGGLGAIGGMARNMLPQRAADMKVAEGLRNAGVTTPEQGMARITQDAGPTGAIADIEGMNQTFRGAAGSYGEARNLAEDAMKQRMDNLTGRVREVGKGVIGDNLTPRMRARQIAQQRISESNQNYPPVMARGVNPDKKMLSILNTELGRKSYRQAFDDYNSWHPDDPMDFVKFEDADTVTSVEFWDKVNQRLGDANSYAKEHKIRSDIATSGNLINSVTKRLDDATGGEYQKIRDDFSRLMRQEEAIEYGRQIIKKRDIKADDVVEELRSYTTAERKEVLRGVIGEIDTLAGETVKGGNAARRALRKAETVRKIQSVFIDKDEAADFVTQLQRLSQQAETAHSVLAGSRTTPMAQDISGVKGILGSAIGAGLTGDTSGAVLGSAANLFTGTANPKTMANIVDTTLQVGPEASKRLKRVLSSPTQSVWTPAMAAAGYNAATD